MGLVSQFSSRLLVQAVAVSCFGINDSYSAPMSTGDPGSTFCEPGSQLFIWHDTIEENIA